jgi:hypothetical protein
MLHLEGLVIQRISTAVHGVEPHPHSRCGMCTSIERDTQLGQLLTTSELADARNSKILIKFLNVGGIPVAGGMGEVMGEIDWLW